MAAFEAWLRRRRPRAPRPASKLNRAEMPKVRGSFTNPVLLLKSMPPLTLSSSVMFLAKTATSQRPSSAA